MAEKRIILSSIVASTNSETYETKPVPLGKRWKIKNMKACDMNFGDNVSSVFILKFGTEIIDVITVTGNTHKSEINRDIVGDGVKKISITRINGSAFDKQLFCILSAYETNKE